MRRCLLLQFRRQMSIRFFLLALGLCLCSIFVSLDVWNPWNTAMVGPRPQSSLHSLSPLSELYGPKSRTSELSLKVIVDQTVKDERKFLASLPNLPLIYRKANNPLLGSSNNTCASYPSVLDIHYNNIYWQVLQLSNNTLYLYSAFYDNRTSSKSKPSIRILGMANSLQPTTETNCQIWYDGQSFPVISKVRVHKRIWRDEWEIEEEILYPYMIECIIPDKHSRLEPQSVSLVEQPCDKPTNNLRIINNQPADGRKKSFAVCVKGLEFYNLDNSVRLVEWLELLFLLGADEVFFYDMGIHPNVSKVLNYYESLGRVDIRKISLPGEQPNVFGLLHLYLKNKVNHKRLHELIPYNDCLNRNMYRYKFVLLMDIDEVIVAKSAVDWTSLLEEVSPGAVNQYNNKWTSFCASNVYFLDTMQPTHSQNHSIPPYLHILQHIYRSANYTKPGWYVKCFHDTERVLTLHNHYAISCLDKCEVKNLPTELAQLQHYRQDCVRQMPKKHCIYFKNHTVVDTRVWRYKDSLMNNALRTLRHLGFLEEVIPEKSKLL
ncbi:uncharacterized protein [Cherax quadricarinatus]